MKDTPMPKYKKGEKLYGWFDSPSDTEPSYNPPKVCLYCVREIGGNENIKTVSLMANSKSFFYRVHKGCYALTDEKGVELYESSIIDNHE